MSSSSQPVPPKKPSLKLRVWEPTTQEEAGDGFDCLSSQMTLSAFYTAYFQPAFLVLRDSAKNNIKQYDETIGYWKRFTGDPPLCEIDYVACGDFIKGLRALPGRKRESTMANNTVRKHARTLQTVLDLTGPVDRQHRQAANLLTRVPYLERPPEDENPTEDSFTLEEIGQIIDACRFAGKRRGLPMPTPVFWRNLYKFNFNVPLRIDTLLRIEWEMISDDGLWIKVPAKIIKRRRGAEFYLNDAARAALDELKAFKHASPRIFPWPNWPKCQSNFQQRHRKHIQRKAGLPPHRQLGFTAVRKAHFFYVARINGMAASMSGNHKQQETTRKHYIRKQLLSETLVQLPQPAKPQTNANGERQQKLFD